MPLFLLWCRFTWDLCYRYTIDHERPGSHYHHNSHLSDKLQIRYYIDIATQFHLFELSILILQNDCIYSCKSTQQATIIHWFIQLKRHRWSETFSAVSNVLCTQNISIALPLQMNIRLFVLLCIDTHHNWIVWFMVQRAKHADTVLIIMFLIRGSSLLLSSSIVLRHQVSWCWIGHGFPPHNSVASAILINLSRIQRVNANVKFVFKIVRSVERNGMTSLRGFRCMSKGLEF